MMSMAWPLRKLMMPMGLVDVVSDAARVETVVRKVAVPRGQEQGISVCPQCCFTVRAPGPLRFDGGDMPAVQSSFSLSWRFCEDRMEMLQFRLRFLRGHGGGGHFGPQSLSIRAPQAMYGRLGRADAQAESCGGLLVRMF